MPLAAVFTLLTLKSGPTDGSTEETISTLAGGKKSLQDWTEEDMTQLARSIVSKPDWIPGESLMQSTSANDEETQLRLDEQWITHLLNTLKLGNSVGMDPIAVDAFGKLDVEYRNPGPEINPKGQLTFSPYAQLLNEEEIKSKQAKERKRTLQSFVLHPPDDEEDNDSNSLWFEREALSRRSSVSSVSVVSNRGQPSEDYPACDDDCWLRRELYSHHGATVAPGEHVNGPLAPAPIYKPLKSGETRILRLHPVPKDQPISCELLTIQIPVESEDSEHWAKYDALSYCWGTMLPDRQVLCNDFPLLIRANLYSALVALRSSTQIKDLWVDALCIDQENVAERNMQVGLMMAIYKGAHSVVVWLGDATANSGIAIEALKQLDSYDWRTSVLMHSHTPTCHSNLRVIYDAQAALFERSWFRRSWIRQEVTVSKTCLVRCGDDELTWYQLKRGANRLKLVYRKLELESDMILPPFPKASIEPLQYLVRGWVFGQPVIAKSAEIRSIWYYHGGSLLDLLMVGRVFDATDPRDKVYSVLGLAKVPLVEADSTSPDTNPMVVDYSKTTSEVYQYLAKYIINRDRNLDILCILLTHRNENSADLPSWVPDWRVSTGYAGLLDCWDFFSSKFAASGFTKAEIQDQSMPEKLLVQGLCLDQVGQLLDYTTSIPRGADVPYTPVLAFDKSRHLRRLCRTVYEYTGLVPRDARGEDLIFILHGAKIPIVLRPVESEDANEEDLPEFEVIGPCWIPEIMFGRVMKAIEEGLEVDVFHMYLV